MRTLVVGCDASGKSSLLEGIGATYGDEIIESTSTEESRRFKRANLERLVTNEFVTEREKLYLNLSHAVLSDVVSRQLENYVGTDATLVTRLSHAVMRRCISGETYDIDRIIESWNDDEETIGVERPDIIALTHAPFATITGRISKRQASGNKDEKFWGFNSPFFLDNYQNAWRSTLPALAEAGFTCIEFNTAEISQHDALEGYSDLRRSLISAPERPV